MTNSEIPSTSSIALTGTLAEAWALPPSEQFPKPGAGAAVIVGGRLITLYGEVLAELVGLPEGTRVAVLLDAIPDRETRNRYRLRPRAVRTNPASAEGRT